MSEEKVVQSQNGGRPFKSIDWKFVDQALQAHCSGVEIAAYLGIHYDTLYDATVREHGKSFSEYSAEKKAKGKSLLRITQFDEAVRKRDRGMLVWLGKQLLDQRDNKDSKVEHGGTPTITIANYGNNPNPLPYQSDEENKIPQHPQESQQLCQEDQG